MYKKWNSSYNFSPYTYSYRTNIEDIFEVVAEEDVLLELNCSQFTYCDPTEDKIEAYRTLIQRSREEGVKLILSSDAHIP